MTNIPTVGDVVESLLFDIKVSPEELKSIQGIVLLSILKSSVEILLGLGLQHKDNKFIAGLSQVINEGVEDLSPVELDSFAKLIDQEKSKILERLSSVIQNESNR